MADRNKARQMEDYLPELAALYHESVDELTQPEETLPGKIEEYRYFDDQKIAESAEIDPDELQAARQILRDHAYRNFRMRQTIYPGNDRPLAEGRCGEAVVTLGNGNIWAELIFDRERLVKAECNSWSCYGIRRQQSDTPCGHVLCRHEAVALTLLQEYLEKENPGDATNESGARLLQKVFVGRDSQQSLTTGQVGGQLQQLEPYVFIDEGEKLNVYFRIGITKLYKVKSLPQLRNAIRQGETMQFGSSTVLNLGMEYLDEKGRKWLELIEKTLDEEKMRSELLNRQSGGSMRYYYGEHGYEFTIKDFLPLFGVTLDRFFALARDSWVEFQYKTTYRAPRKKEQIFCQEGVINPVLTLAALKDQKGIYQGVRLSGALPSLIQGSAHSYMLDEKNQRFTQLTGEKNADLMSLEQLAQFGQINIVIGRNNLRSFYHDYLPALKQIAQIKEDPADQELTAQYLPPDASFVCFLDADAGNVVCRPCVYYRDTMFAVTDLKLPEAHIDSIRDVDTERRLLSLLDEYFERFDSQLQILFTPREDEAVFHFLDEGLERLLAMSEVRSTERFRRLGVRRTFRINMGVSVASGLMDLEVLSTEFSQDELLSLLDSYRQKKRFVRLRSGDFLKLEGNDEVEQLSELLDSLHIKPKEFVQGKMHIPAYRALYLDRMLETSNNLYADRDRSFKSLIKQFKTIADADFELPISLHDVLRKYQKEGYRWLRTLDANHFGGILADEMGLGKTLQVITVLWAVRMENDDSEKRPSLIVCPASLVYNWAEELKRFAPELSYTLVVGTAAQRREQIRQAGHQDVLVTSYDLLKRDIDAYEDMVFRFQVIDEAQYIKNHTTAAAKAVKVVRADTKYALTGTPIENRLSELWSIFDYLMPGFLYEYSTFRQELEIPIVKYEDEEAQKRLSRMVSPFILRRLKVDVLKDLPEKLEEIRYAGMDTTQRRLYDAQVVKMRNTLQATSDSDFQRQRIQILAELTKLRQICCDPSLCFEDYHAGSAKREAVMDLIRGAIEGGHRMLLFSQFVHMLELLETDLLSEGIDYYVINGSTPKHKRVELVNAFNEGDVPVFLISLKAGGTGLNLTGADTVIHYDPWWNLAVQNQATDRAHRIGQQHIVTVYKMITKDTIEEKIVELQETKKKLAEDILTGESISSAAISREDLLGMLE